MQTETPAAADRNLARLWEALIGVTPTPRATRDEDALLLASGLPVPLFNPAIVAGPVADPAATLGRVTAHYAALGVPFVLWFRDAVTPGLAGACEAAGLVEHWQPPLMVLEPVTAAPSAPADLRIETLTADSIAEHAAVLAAGFGMPRELLETVAVPDMVDVPGLTVLIGRAGGEPVATAVTFVGGGAAGIYNVATVPEVRGRGFGAAITWAAVEAGRRAGCTRAILQASEQGAPVYARMGFATPDRYRQYQPA